MRTQSLSILLLSLTAILNTNCTRQISPNVYSANSIGEASRTYSGTIVGMRTVEVQDKERLEENGLGLMGGAVAGGLAGSFMGKGMGQVAATGLGAVLGATGGALLEKEVKKQSAFEYIVRLKDGSALTVVQGMENPLNIGQKVLVIVSNHGRSRVIPDNGLTDGFNNPATNINLNVR